MHAQQLYKKNGSSAEVFYCGKCGVVYRSKEDADRCCVCSSCKSVGRERNSIYCEECGKKHNEQKRREIEEKERKVLNDAEVTDEWEYVWYNDQMYSDLDELIESCDGNPPEFVFAMKPRCFDGFDFDDIIENKAEQCEIDDDYNLSDMLIGIDKLREAIENVNKINATNIIWWDVDMKHKVCVEKGGE